MRKDGEVKEGGRERIEKLRKGNEEVCRSEEKGKRKD